jgi:hypothetical protein
VIAFEPDGASFTQYFFVGADEFADAGLQPEVAAAISRRLEQPATWLWFSRSAVPSLDEAGRIAMAVGEEYCARHGAEKLCAAFSELTDANLFYINEPYGEAGAYVWI